LPVLMLVKKFRDKILATPALGTPLCSRIRVSRPQDTAAFAFETCHLLEVWTSFLLESLDSPYNRYIWDVIAP
jgi:hypothetical protein